MKRAEYFLGGLLFMCLMRNPALFAGPQSADASLLASKKEVEKAYVLEAGDRIRVKIYPDDPFIRGGDMQISSDGNITLSLLGKVHVEGKPVNEVERLLSEKIDQDYIVSPEVVIEVLQFREKSVVLLGEVRKPGTYPFPQGATQMTLLEAVSLAGGFSDIANIKKVKIIRKRAEGTGEVKEILHANAEAIISGEQEDVPLESGDVVHVSESLF